jgi:ABC-2 type transport system ATP-binding protein
VDFGDAAVVVERLVKVYPRNPVPAVDGVSFTVARGEIFGLLGPNGAGKTTTIGVLTTRVLPTSGRAWVAGVDVVADPVGAKRHVAVVPQRNNLDRSLSIRHNLLFHAAYHGVPRRERNERAALLLEQFGLADRANERVDLFSGGQNQRIMIARALMHAPDVLFLDEPTTGLDPAARLFLWDRLRELRASGVTTVITTHDMDEAAELSDRVGIVDHGHLLVLDTPDALAETLPGKASLEIHGTVETGGSVTAIVEELSRLDHIERVEMISGGPGPQTQPSGGAPGMPVGPPPGAPVGPPPNGQLADAPADQGGFRARLYVSSDPARSVGPVVALLIDRHVTVNDLRMVKASLEDVFLHLTGRLLR